MNIEELQDAFAEGVSYVTREGWVSPDDIEDSELRSKYSRVVRLYDEFQEACWEFQTALDDAGDIDG